MTVKLNLAGKTIASLFLAATMLASLAEVPVKAQSDQWNALYDKINRLEADVRAIRQQGGSAGGGAVPGNRLGAIEDQLRRLVGQVQSMNSQMQRMRREIDYLKKRPGQQGSVQPQPRVKKQIATVPSYQTYGNPETEVVVEYDGVPAQGPKPLGQLALRQDGTTAGQPIAGGTLPNNGQPSALPGRVETATLGAPQGASSAASKADDPDGLFNGSKAHLLGRRFGLAEAGFKLFISQHRNDRKAARAHYWLGETYYSQGRYRQAAQTFLNGYRGYGKSSAAPDLLLKLGMSLSRLGQTKQACSTLKEVAKKYRKKASTRKVAQQEIQRAGC